jgi:thiamine biosynthesis lipoprotein
VIRESTSLTSPRTLACEVFPLWGGQASVTAPEPSQLRCAVGVVKQTVEAFDRACSSFRADSELAALNASAGQPVVVSSLLLTAVGEAVRAARETAGAVNPTVGRALIAHGFSPQLRSPGRPWIEPAPGYRAVVVDEVASTVHLPRGVCLDLGATAKALAADIGVSAAVSEAGCGILVALCGDIATAGEPPAGGWKIRVTDDHRARRGVGQTVTIRAGGIATSSTAVRRARDGVTHHLIDPATGLPTAGPWRTASVAARSCLEANTASTAAIVLGARATAWLEHRRLPARLVATDASVRYIGGWPTEEDDL